MLYNLYSHASVSLCLPLVSIMKNIFIQNILKFQNHTCFTCIVQSAWLTHLFTLTLCSLFIAHAFFI